MDDVVSKPFRLEELVPKVESYVQKYREQAVKRKWGNMELNASSTVKD